MSKRKEKDLYKSLEQQVADAYAGASEADKKRIDALRQTIYNYQTADPMTNRDARRLYIDGYQRMLDLASGGSGYDPTRLGNAVTNEWGYYSPDEVTNIGNQLAYTLFHNKDLTSSPSSATHLSNTGGGNSDFSQPSGDWKHTTFVWNKGMMDPSYFTAATTKTQKVKYFADQLKKNLEEVINKQQEGYVVHGLNDLTKLEDINSAIRMLDAAKNLDWDNSNEETDKVFQGIGLLASMLKIDPAEMGYYFDLDGAALTDPEAAERAAKLKELNLREVDTKGLDAQVLNYLSKNNWQLLADKDGVIKVYNSDYSQAQPYAYLQDDPNASDYNRGFFINNNGQYLYIPNIEEYADWSNQDFGPMVGSAVDALKKSRNWNNVGTYNPYHSYESISNPESTSMQDLLDQIAQRLGSTNFQFIDMSGYFRGDDPVIGIPTNGQITKDYFGNIQFDPSMTVFKLDATGKLVPMTFQEASAEGYNYAGYGTENMSQYQTKDLLSLVESDLDNLDIVNFNLGDNRWGINKLERMMNGYGKSSTAEITKTTAPAWANAVMSMLLNPQGKMKFDNKNLRNLEVLTEMGYDPTNPKPFIQGLYLFLKEHELLDKVNQSDMRKVLKLLIPTQSDSQVVSAQMGTVLDYNNKEYKPKTSNPIPEQLKEKENSGREVDEETGESKLSEVAATRLASLGVDLVSLVSAMLPGAGTLISAGTGLGSTIMNFGADIAEDGLDGKDFGRLLLNIGLDAVGLVGGTGKIPKIMRTIGTLFPVLWGSAGLLKNGDQFKEILQKTQRGQTLSLQDWQLLAQGVQIIVSGTRGAKNMIRSKNIAKLQSIKDAGAGNEAKYVIKGVDASGNQKDITLSKSQLEKIAAAQAKPEVKGTKKKPGTPAQTALEAANAELHKIPEYKDVSLIPNTKREGWRLKKVEQSDNPLYDFDFSKPDVPSISQTTYNDAVSRLLGHRRGFLFNRDGIITLPAKKDGGKLDRLQQYINEK